jgi:hypothetical protein
MRGGRIGGICPNSAAWPRRAGTGCRARPSCPPGRPPVSSEHRQGRSAVSSPRERLTPRDRRHERGSEEDQAHHTDQRRQHACAARASSSEDADGPAAIARREQPRLDMREQVLSPAVAPRTLPTSNAAQPIQSPVITSALTGHHTHVPRKRARKASPSPCLAMMPSAAAIGLQHEHRQRAEDQHPAQGEAELDARGRAGEHGARSDEGGDHDGPEVPRRFIAGATTRVKASPRAHGARRGLRLGWSARRSRGCTGGVGRRRRARAAAPRRSPGSRRSSDASAISTMGRPSGGNCIAPSAGGLGGAVSLMPRRGAAAPSRR